MNHECLTCEKRGGYYCTDECEHWEETTPTTPHKTTRPVHLERALRLCAAYRRDAKYYRKRAKECHLEYDARAYRRDAIAADFAARKIYREVVR